MVKINFPPSPLSSHPFLVPLYPEYAFTDNPRIFKDSIDSFSLCKWKHTRHTVLYLAFLT